MNMTPEFIKRYHIFTFDSQDHKGARFSNGVTTVEYPCSLDIARIFHASDRITGSVAMLHELLGGNWLTPDGRPNKCYFAPFSSMHVRPGEIVLLRDENQHYEGTYYMGQGKYLYPCSHPVLLSLKQMEVYFPSYVKCSIKNPDMHYDNAFYLFYHELLAANILQFDNIKGTMTYPFPGSQRLHESYVSELYSLYIAFGKQKARDIISDLNQRRVVCRYGCYALHQNRNSSSFYRDANYSFSIVDDRKPDAPEIAIISFAPSAEGVIDIVQIGGNDTYTVDFMDMWSWMIEFMKQYSRGLGFRSLRVLRGDKNVNFVFPKQRSLRDTFDICAHQQTMLLRYNVTPHRKWGFAKPDKRYSEYVL